MCSAIDICKSDSLSQAAFHISLIRIAMSHFMGFSVTIIGHNNDCESDIVVGFSDGRSFLKFPSNVHEGNRRLLGNELTGKIQQTEQGHLSQGVFVELDGVRTQLTNPGSVLAGMFGCAGCGKRSNQIKDFSQCQRCKNVRYCGKECQCLHWKKHKLVCLPALPFKCASDYSKTEIKAVLCFDFDRKPIPKKLQKEVRALPVQAIAVYDTTCFMDRSLEDDGGHVEKGIKWLKKWFPKQSKILFPNK